MGLLVDLILNFPMHCPLFYALTNPKKEPEVPGLPSFPGIPNPTLPPLPQLPGFPKLPDLKDITSLVPTGIVHDLTEVAKTAEEFFSTLPPSTMDDAKLDTIQYATKYGYPAESHEVTTEDGYILTLHRIPYGLSGPSENRTPILVVHGIMSSSADWVISGIGYSLAFELADDGYDVWLGNCRGNTYSQKHVRYTTDDSAFWDFSFEQVAQLDLPAMIDFVLKTNGQEKLFYVGHSHGTTVIFTLLSEMPEYNAKVRAAVSLAPIAYMDHLVSPVMRMFNPDCLPVEAIVALFGNKDFAPHSAILSQVSSFFTIEGPSRILLTNIMFAVCGFSPDQTRDEILPVQMAHSPAGVSTKQLMHYGQEMRSGRFCKWDFGLFHNQQHYEAAEPPAIKLHQITAPQIIFYSNNDWLSSPLDVGRLFIQMTGTMQKEGILTGDGKFNHMDYLFGKDAPMKVNDILLEKLRKL